jgi:hypothetical protein
MTLGRLSIITAALSAFCIGANAGPVTYTLDTTGYNFQLNGGGGGAQATLNGNQNIEIYCVDYANDIYVPAQGYSAILTTLTQNSSLTYTRFGNVSSSNWTQMNTSDIGSTDATTIDDSTDLGRYQMAAYLVSLYNMPAGNNTSNNGIQQAIWDILDPLSYSAVYNSATNTALEDAAQWYTTTGGNTGSTARNNFLANFRIVSDSTMYSCGAGWALCGGFQEQITVVPEPRHLAMMLLAMLIAGALLFRKLQPLRSQA